MTTVARAGLRLAVAGEVLGEAVGAELEPLGDRAQLALEPRGQRERERLGLLGVGGARGLGREACAPRRRRASASRRARAGRPCRPGCARASRGDSVWSRLPVNSSLAASLDSAPPSAASMGLSEGGSDGDLPPICRTPTTRTSATRSMRLRRAELNIEGHGARDYARERLNARQLERRVCPLRRSAPEPS